MKIGIDCRLVAQTGVGRYTRNLIENLIELDKKNEYVLFVRSEDIKDIKSVVSDQVSIVAADIPWHGIREQIELPKILNRQELDLVHFPYFSVPLFYYKPFVVTIHDLIINRFATGRASTLPYPLYLVKRLGYHGAVANAVYRSKKIIVPSDSVKDDILKNYKNVKSSKIVVTYEGSFDSLPNKKSEPKIKGDYFLRVGNFYPHKNVERLVAAFHDFIFEHYMNKDTKLVLVGKKDFFYKKIEREVKQLNLENNVVLVEEPADADLINLYENSKATIVPSFAEGFSLTAVEALTCGSPALASDIPVHREVCGAAAIYFNPANVEDMKQKMDFAVNLVPESRKELVLQGRKLSKKFSWEKMAQATLDVYNSSI